MPINHASSTPLYEQIRDYIRDQITSGHLAGNSRLPSERQLAEQFRVSRLTVTRALRELEWEGLVHSRVGKGTFVVGPAPISQKVETLWSFTEYMTAQNKRVANRVLAASIEPASKETAATLQIDIGAPLFVLERLRFVDDQPVAIEHASLPYALCPGIDQNHDFASESLYQVLRDEYGLFLTSARQTVEARPATSTEAGLLGIKTGDPVLGFTRTTRTDANVPIEFVRSAYRGDSYQLRLDLKSSPASDLSSPVADARETRVFADK